MLPELAAEEFSLCLDEVVNELLRAAEWDSPPVDAVALARRCGMPVAIDNRLSGRARTVRLMPDRNSELTSILLRPEPRAERRQWAVAHEIGEQLAARVFRRLSVSPLEIDQGARERVANLLAGRLLLPGEWFAADAQQLDWNIPLLKARYSTASHELIARRMLDFAPPVIISVFDQGKRTWRRSNQLGRLPGLSPVEEACWRAAHEIGVVREASDGDRWVQAWPVHEPDWRREIVRTALPEL